MSEWQDRARERADQHRAMHNWSNRTLAKKAGIDTKTINAFLAGNRWPSNETRARLEAALGLPGGALSVMGDQVMQQAQTSTPSVNLASITDAQLLAEIAARFERGREQQQERDQHGAPIDLDQRRREAAEAAKPPLSTRPFSPGGPDYADTAAMEGSEGESDPEGEDGDGNT